MTLRSNVSMLIRPHLSYDASGKLGTAQALLTQLTSEAGSSGSSAGNERPIPGSIKAMSLFVQLEWDARNEQYMRTGDDSGGLWQIVSSWENLNDPEFAPHLEHVTADWIAEISNTINPPRSRRPLRQPCASCGQRWTYDRDGKRAEAVTAWVWDDLGEKVATVEKWDVQCSVCGAEWRGKEVAQTYWRAVA